MTSQSNSWPKYFLPVMGCAIGLGALLRGWNLMNVPIDFDEVKQTQAMLLIQTIREQGAPAILWPKPAWSPEAAFFWQFPIYHLTVIGLSWLFQVEPQVQFARLVTIGCSLLTAWPLFRIGKSLTGKPSVGFWTAVVFLLLPVAVLMGRVVMDDALFVLLLCGAFASFLHWREEGTTDRYLWLGCGLWIAANSIRPYGMILAFPVVACCWKKFGGFWWGRRRVHLLFSLVAAFLGLWLYHMQQTNAVWSQYPLYATPPESYPTSIYKPLGFITRILFAVELFFNREFWFGSMAHFFRDFVCPLPFVPFLLAGLWLMVRRIPVGRWWLFGYGLYFFLTSRVYGLEQLFAMTGVNLDDRHYYYGHQYYLYLFAPLTAFCVGLAIGTCSDWWRDRLPEGKQTWIPVLVGMAVVFVGCGAGLKTLTSKEPYGPDVYEYNPRYIELGNAIRQFCTPTDRVVVTAPKSHFSYPLIHCVAQRKGWNLPPDSVREDLVEFLRDRGATLWVIEGNPAEWPEILQLQSRRFKQAGSSTLYWLYDLTSIVHANADVPNWIPYSFITPEEIEKAVKVSASDNDTMRVRWDGLDPTLSGEGRNYLTTQPMGDADSYATYELESSLPIPTELQGFIGIRWRGEETPTDGVIAYIDVENQGTKKRVLERRIDPRSQPDDRGWVKFSVDLEPMPEGTVKITFGCNAGPVQDAAFDVAGWADVKLWPEG